MAYIKEFTAHPELLQVQSLIPFAPWVTASRAAMFASEIGQACVLSGADPRFIQSGMEREFGKGTSMEKLPCNANICSVIHHYPPGGLKNAGYVQTPTTVIYQDMDADIPQFGIVHIPHSVVNHHAFGFEYRRTELGSSICRGMSVPRGTILAHSPSLRSNGDYCYGINAKIAFMSIPEVGQDAVVMSESFSQRCKFRGYGEVKFTFGEDEIPLNLYGTDEEYKLFPDIGEQIRDDGIIIGKRRLVEGLEPIQMNGKNLRRPNDNDTCKHVVGGATVVSVSVVKSVNKRHMLPTTMVEQPERYHEAQVNTAKELKRAYYDILKFYPDGHTPNLTPELHQFFVRAEIPVMGTSKEHIRTTLVDGSNPLPEWSVTITYSYMITPTETHKLADTTGGKGVVGVVWPDERMPIDEDGNRVDIIMDAGSIVNRSNPARLYEVDITASFMRTRKTILESLAKDDSPENWERQYQWLLGAYRIISPKFAKMVAENRGVVHLEKALKSPYFYLVLPTDNPIRLDKAIVELLRKYPKCHGKLTYMNYQGEMETTVEDITVGVQYIIILEKTGDEYSSVFSPVLQSQGIPGKLSKADKENTAGRPQATRFGETEFRIINSLTESDSMSKMLDIANSSGTHKAVCETLLSHPTPSNVKNIIDRKLHPRGSNRAVNIGNSTMFAAGFIFEYREVID